ncbi:glycerol-3-phosphate acyltransferase [Oceanithermus sp.]
MYELAFAAGLGYLLGSLPFAVWFGWIQRKNVLAEGSGNPGAINAIRVLGLVPGLMVLVLDVFKGFLAAFYGSIVGGTTGALVGGVAAVFGHVCSFWLACRGGKGIATAAGVWLAIQPLVVALTAAVWLGSWLYRRDAYQAFAIAAALLAPLVALVTRSLELTLTALTTAALLLRGHWRYLAR